MDKPDEREPSKPDQSENLLNLVIDLVDQDSWSSSGQGYGEAKIVNGLLIVNQEESTHRKILNLIQDLEGFVMNKKPMPKKQISLNEPNRPLETNLAGGSESGPFDRSDDSDENPFSND